MSEIDTQTDDLSVEEFLEEFGIYVLEVSSDTSIKAVRFHPSHLIEELEEWKPGILLNALYDEFPIFLHFLNQALRGKKVNTIITLSDNVFEARFIPNQDKDGGLNSAGVYLKKIYDVRQKKFGLSDTHEKRFLANAEEDIASKLSISDSSISSNSKHDEQMASLGLHLSGIAHEMNNPIGFIMNNMSALKMSFDDLADIMPESDDSELSELMEDMRAMLGDLEEGAIRTARIAKSLTVYARTDKKEKEITSIHDLLRSTLTILKYKTKNRISIETTFDEKLQGYSCFPGRINQIFMNIITNAIHAISEDREDGIIFISTKDEAKQISISIKDNGTGMSEETRKRIFEPLFTTKPAGVGTGLGMSITKEILDEHNGKIQVDSEVGIGTEFTIILPKE